MGPKPENTVISGYIWTRSTLDGITIEYNEGFDYSPGFPNQLQRSFSPDHAWSMTGAIVIDRHGLDMGNAEMESPQESDATPSPDEETEDELPPELFDPEAPEYREPTQEQMEARLRYPDKVGIDRLFDPYDEAYDPDYVEWVNSHYEHHGPPRWASYLSDDFHALVYGFLDSHWFDWMDRNNRLGEPALEVCFDKATTICFSGKIVAKRIGSERLRGKNKDWILLECSVYKRQDGSHLFMCIYRPTKSPRLRCCEIIECSRDLNYLRTHMGDSQMEKDLCLELGISSR